MHTRQILSSTALATAAVLLFGACAKPDAENPPDITDPDNTTETSDTAGSSAIESIDQRASYGIGYNVGSNIARQGGLEVDQAALVAGLEDGLGGAETRVDQADIQSAFTVLQERANAAQAEAGTANLEKANAFLAENAERSGITVTESGLQYEVLASGDGAKPTESDTVEVHYHGTLPDGTVFDSSVDRGETIEFAVTGVIKGWTEALQLMSVGDKWKLFIPPGLAYGPRATGSIPPNSALVFEVELISIK